MRAERLTQEESIESLRHYTDWVLQVGDGTVPTLDTRRKDIIEIPPKMVCSSLQVYDDFESHYMDPKYLYGRAILACTSELVQRLPGESPHSVTV